MYHKAAPSETKKRDLHQDGLNGFFAILGVTEMKKKNYNYFKSCLNSFTDTRRVLVSRKKHGQRKRQSGFG